MITSAATLELTPAKWPSVKKLALKGVASAQYLMGVAHLIGGVVDVDRKKAFHWFSLAAQQQHADAAFRCGYILSVSNDSASGEALHWYTVAANNGSAAGMVALGNLWTFEKLKLQSWLDRIIHRPDNSQAALTAFAWYKKAADKEYATAFYFLALHTLKGWGAPRSSLQAGKYLKAGMEENDADCAYLLAEVKGRRDPEFWDYCERAADLGHSQAQYRLGVSLLRKRHTIDQGVAWLRRASMQQHPKAMLAMSTAYEKGTGVVADLVSAYVWAKRASAAGLNAEARMALLLSRMSDDQRTSIASEAAGRDDLEFFRLSQTLFGAEYVPGSLYG
jgi:TPR repeat protein